MDRAAAFTEKQNDVLAKAGALLLAIQFTEKTIAFSATYILQLNGPVTLELLEREKLRKRTLGQLLEAMRRRIDIAENFDAALTEFLEKRNIFIHRLEDVEGWSLDDDEGIVTANRFLGRLLQLIEIVLDVFFGLARAWALENPNMPPFPDIHIRAPFHLIIDRIFSAKKSV